MSSKGSSDLLQMFTLCRDCLGFEPAFEGACSKCGSERTFTHPELAQLNIAHVDCDAFYASVEKRDDPSLNSKPLLIGHDGARGVVTTACYIARTYGCRSAMPMYRALQLCPDAIVLPPDMAKYKAASVAIRELFQEVTRLFEPVSIDEAYLDLSEEHRLLDKAPAVLLAQLSKEVEAKIGVTISVGLSYNKFLAKLASDLDKPHGFSAIGVGEALAFLSPLPVTKIHGVGQATAAKMEQLGWTTIGQLQAVNERELAARFGRFGHRLAQFVKGEDDRPVKASRIAKSISAETTFSVNLWRVDELTRALEPLCERIARNLKAKTIAGRTVTLKLKTGDFRIITRRVTFHNATQSGAIIFAAAQRLLQQEADGRNFRLIGVGISDLCPDSEADPPNLFELMTAPL